MLHGPAVELGKDNSIPKKTRLGVILFIIYSVVYAGFVYIGTVHPESLGLATLGGLNLAFVYGMGLILLAAIMGLAYNYFCTRYERLYNKEEEIK
ncbi:MAG: DUF485 domain-containing protein [Candidatus Kapabacteria bacterium]|nr:DUF485 domain-containing protein [Ignavibacteriota bacterium]MCW5884726.1 DUF485 domain-containing protein [Candidatus Kapabacteria bacterium]